MRIERATLADAEVILELQKLAYRQEAAIYDDYGIAPLHQTLAEMEEDLRQMVVLKAVHAAASREAMAGDRVVGSVRALARDDTCFIGRLIVHPDHQNRGIGTRLMAEIEALFPEVRRYELFTGHRSEKNLHLYDKLGYRPRRTQRLSERLTLVYLEKAHLVHQCEDRE
mgnify:CR=1 FL=1